MDVAFVLTGPLIVVPVVAAAVATPAVAAVATLAAAAVDLVATTAAVPASTVDTITVSNPFLHIDFSRQLMISKHSSFKVQLQILDTQRYSGDGDCVCKVFVESLIVGFRFNRTFLSSLLLYTKYGGLSCFLWWLAGAIMNAI
ncbi:hypothetical protein FN846DRAFT_524114 [Sphaerosporella brunnea]|uniref:Uncharacterized protein n=1 Tax=Sphaerosporella brunnea TaxID=1250544 RepID=A0A5J5EET2_9PEZI|nr:hypothetical protein FN846DRAFT_524060 [Sphaerosporella brunnea]KAA8893479.1 hypothetical protein FN846DRAFT_524114 [Sphaerosporella brunnea]